MFDNKYLKAIHNSIAEAKREGLVPKKILVGKDVYNKLLDEDVYFDSVEDRLFGIPVEISDMFEGKTDEILIHYNELK